MIYGLFEAHLHVTNLDRSAEFYENVLGLKLGYYAEKRRAKPELGVVPWAEWEAMHGRTLV